MDINGLLLFHGSKRFKVDTQDALGVFMNVDEYKLHIRQDDIILAEGLTINEFHPLIDSLEKR